MLHTFAFHDLFIPGNVSAPPTRIDTGYLIPPGRVALLHPFGETEFYRHGWNSWSPSGWTRTDGETIGIKNSPGRLLTADDAVNDTPHAHSGSAVGAIAGPNGDVLLLGSLGLGTPRVGADGNTLWARAEHDEAGWFVAYGPEQKVFADYADLVSERLGRRSQKAGRVWSSWYSFYEGIDEQLVARTAADLSGYPFDVFQLDDGWEPIVGDWTAGPDFPSGMEATARTIRDAGFRPGLWLAPLIALPQSPIVRERPDLLVKDEHGQPLVTGYNWGSHYHSLDTTQDEVKEHLREVFTRVTGWGFSYLKLDFMYAGAVPGHRQRDLHREAAYRDAIQHIRQVVGDEVYLLGCGVPMIPSVGVFDGARVGPDVGAFWDNAERVGDPSGVGARNSIIDSVNRAWMKRLYEVDPDAVYFRSARNLLDASQRGMLQDVAAILEFKSTSDPVEWLSESEREELRRYLERSNEVRQLGRYTFSIDGREVDLTAAVTGTYVPEPPSVVA
ncbi:alpha-galactosidase [Diaminobutyricimonas aerilata]|uniref:Alpha-galactosidase n=1 Tax=Diaminobutyricimonas aerilata TaxID=1162967 RepID=A0A2M9CG31_9MICO|nr:glycoside hydrolase family 36 protein [Diaminobutyricimonas aerilata]PJJ70837.1 alpha-galactosidase [Diaminobutyricimonas aerilata]